MDMAPSWLGVYISMPHLERVELDIEEADSRGQVVRREVALGTVYGGAELHGRRAPRPPRWREQLIVPLIPSLPSLRMHCLLVGGRIKARRRNPSVVAVPLPRGADEELIGPYTQRRLLGTSDRVQLKADGINDMQDLAPAARTSVGQHVPLCHTRGDTVTWGEPRRHAVTSKGLHPFTLRRLAPNAPMNQGQMCAEV